MAPVAFCVQVAEIEAILVAKLDARQQPLINSIYGRASCKSQKSECRNRFVRPLGAIFVVNGIILAVRLAYWHFFMILGESHPAASAA